MDGGDESIPHETMPFPSFTFPLHHQFTIPLLISHGSAPSTLSYPPHTPPRGVKRELCIDFLLRAMKMYHVKAKQGSIVFSVVWVCGNQCVLVKHI